MIHARHTRLWRTVKYEDIYIKDYQTVPALTAGLDTFFNLYNYERPHQSFGYAVPADVHFAVKDQFYDRSIHLIFTDLWS